MKFWNLWAVARFWWLWSAAAPIAAMAFGVFFLLLTRGVVSSENILPWCAILLVLTAIMGGSLWLRSNGHPNFAALPLLFLLIPILVSVGGALLFSAFYFLLFLFGKGRMN